MDIQLRFFASVRETLGTGQEALALPSDVRTVGELRAFLRRRGGVWQQALAEGRALRVACNQRMADAATTLEDGAEVAFFPPVTGG